MSDLLLRRREMMKSDQHIVSLIYQNSEPITTSGVVLPDVILYGLPYGFSILLDCTCNHYSWASTQSVIMIGSGSSNNLFRVGRINNGEEYTRGEVTTASVNRYFALIANSATNGKRMFSMYPKGSNASTTKRVAISFDASTKRVAAAYRGSNFNWYNLPNNPYTESGVLRSWQNGASGTINDLKIYNGVLSDEELLAYTSSS